MIGNTFYNEVNMLQFSKLSILFLFLISCSSLMKKEKKVEFDLQAPNIRIENFPVTFNLKGKGGVLTRCAGNNCLPEEIAKLDASSIKGFTKEGEWEEYTEIADEDGKKKQSYLKFKGTYKSGKKEGFWEEYEAKLDVTTKTRKVVKKQSGNYKDEKKEGVWTLWAETGERLKETTYVAGKKHGPEKKYSLKGPQTEETNYVEDEREGVYWKKNSSELAECEGAFTKDKKIGIWKEYNTESKKPDKLKATYNYAQDKRDGAATLYQEDGVTKLAEGNYKENFKIGFWKQFYPNGKVESEGNRKAMPQEGVELKEQDSSCPTPNANGKSVNTGEWKKYYQSGDLFSVGSYDDKGQPVKDWKFFYKGNKLRCKGTMANSIMMKNGELFDQSGALQGKGNMMLSMFSIDDKTDEMKEKVIPALPFTFYKDGKKYLEILPATIAKEPTDVKAVDVEQEEVRKETTAIEYNASGAKVGEGPYIFIPTQPYGGKKHGCRTEGGKKAYYIMGVLKEGTIAEMSNCK